MSTSSNICTLLLTLLAFVILSESAGYDAISRKLDCTKPNEEYQCGSPCQTECATLGQFCPVASYRCVDACYCIKGYARDASGTCIPEANCPARKPGYHT